LDLYSTPLWEAHLCSAQAWITQFLHRNYTTPACLYLVKHSPDGVAADSDNSHLIAAYYSFIDPERKKG